MKLISLVKKLSKTQYMVKILHALGTEGLLREVSVQTY